MSRPMLDLRSLRQFVAVAETLHFGRAAELLHMTQPPLTQAIQKLEQELGAELLARTRRRVALTPAGESLLQAARQLLADADRLPALVQAAQRGLNGHLRLGFVSTVGYGQMPQWLRGFREHYPGIALSLHEATLDVQLQAFERGELDAGFAIHAPGAAPAGFEALQVALEPMVLAHADSFGLAKTSRRALDQALEQPLVVFPRDIAPSLFDALLGFYRGMGKTPRIVQEANQMQTIINLVSAGMGLAWVPESVCALQRPGVRYRRFGSVPPRCETSLIWRTGAAPAVQRFVGHVAQALKTLKAA
ncbi:MAG: LysR family transcriptional regulator [Burkholderiaceae bacterium]|nr:LysR family transcriptional regulator [Burkholderiaceae bacterium]